MSGGAVANLTTGIVSYWSFNSDATDAKGTNNGTLTNSASVVAGGILSNCLNLSSGQMWVSVADNNSLSFGNGSTDLPFSYSFWVKPTNFSQNSWMISKRNLNQNEYQVTVNVTTGTVGFAIMSLNGSNSIGTTSTETLTAGQWKHIVVTYTGNSLASGLKIYFNGVLCTLTPSSAGSYVAMNNGTSVVGIGSWAQFPTSGVIGLMDEVGLWSIELSQAQVSRLYNGGAGLAYSSF